MFDFAEMQDVKAVLGSLKSKDLGLYFVGIGGVGMSALAEHYYRLGVRVSGCDRAKNEGVQRLLKLGVPVTVGEGSVPHATAAVIYTLAVSEDAPLLRAARQMGIPTISRPRLLGALMTDYTRCIGVSGTHGKSSTVAMLAHVYLLCGARPTVISGADVTERSPYLRGGSDSLIYEACEYRDAFLSFHPTVSVITGVELDHTDYFPDLGSLIHSFGLVADSTTDRVIINIDDPGAAALVRDTEKYVTVSRGPSAKYTYREDGDGTSSFRLFRRGEYLGRVESGLLGSHFATDMALAAACAIEEGFSPSDVLISLGRYSGIRRRLELIATRRGVPVYYDYAHHPTEIRAVISTLRAKYGSLAVVFCPHTYSRTKAFWEDFVSALRLADHCVILDIFAAREMPIEGVSSHRLATCVGEGAVHLTSEEALCHMDGLTVGAIALLGAGDMENLKEQIIHSADR